MSGAFNRILHLLTKRKKTTKNGYKSMSQISSKLMTCPLPAQTSIHWTINCGQCWRNVPTPRGTKILTQ